MVALRPSGCVVTWLTIALMLCALITVEPARSTTITVDDDGAADYETIQAAIDAAQPGDVIHVQPGIYYEEVCIDKSVTLKGTDKQSVIHLDNATPGPSIMADNVVFEKFKIMFPGSGLYALSLVEVDNCVVKNCNISTGYGGIYIYRGSGSAIIRNILHNLTYGVSSVGLEDGVIQENYFISNVQGIDLGSDTKDNKVFFNTFVNNVQDAYDDSTTNRWDYAGVGNYWEKYTGVDADDNGIGDVKYPIEPKVRGNFDHYPLMQKYTGVDIYPPSVEQLRATPIIQVPDAYVNISCCILDNTHVKVAKINITLANGTRLNTSLNQVGNTTMYYYNHSYDVMGTYHYAVWANDSDNNSVWIADQTFVIALKPTAALNYTPAHPTRLDSVSFNATDSFDPDGNIVNYTWSLGDGTTAFGESIQYQYTKNRTYTITLTVTDNHGAWDTMQTDITIRNIHPTADFSFMPSNATVGQTVYFYDNSSDEDGGVYSHEWSFGDGATSLDDNPVHAYAQDGTYTITLTVTDDDYDNDTMSHQITVTDVEPPRIDHLTANPNPQEVKGSVNVTCQVVDDVAVSEVRANVSGIEPHNNHITQNVSMQNSGNASWWHEMTYNTSGNYSVSVWTTDPSGNANMSTSYTFTIFSPAVPPEIHDVRANPQQQQYGFPINITCNATDNIALATVGVNITYPDGSTINVSMNRSFINGSSNDSYFYNESFNMRGHYKYTVWAFDINNYINVSGNHSFTIIDTLPPYVTNLSITPRVQQPHEDINISCAIVDNLAVQNVSIQVSQGNETIAVKHMTASPFYYLDRYYNTSGQYNITIYASDTVGNTATFTEHFYVTIFPSVNFSYMPDTPSTEDAITFTDSSSDPDGFIVAWAWDFGDGNTSFGPVVNHSYSNDGLFVVTLTVSDNYGATADRCKEIEVANAPPSAHFTYRPLQPTVVDSLSFDASTSNDPDGHIASYTWQFGDGASAVGVTASHTYAAAGLYTVSLTVVDDDGASHTVHQNITILTASPIADFLYAVNGLQVGVLQNASDPDGYIVNWTWNFGDGTMSYITDPPTHSYSQAGVYTVSLTVVDNDGAQNQSAVTIVLGGVLAANFTYTPPTAYTHEAISFTDSSLAGEGTITMWNWSFGDGTNAYEQHPQHSYQDDGIYPVTLTVTNSTGITDEITHNVTILNTPPNANFMVTPSHPTTQDIVTFNASDSSDPDGSIVNWTWSFGDGMVGYEQHPVHVYDAAGSYTVSLTVRDDDGTSHTSEQVVSVVAGEPSADFDVAVDGLTAMFTDASSDPDGSIVNWTWSFGDGMVGYEQHPVHVYDDAGSYTVSLTVRDDDDASAVVSRMVNASAPPDDWNPWDDDGVITLTELQEAINHWVHDIPKNDHLITLGELQEFINMWLTG